MTENLFLSKTIAESRLYILFDSSDYLKVFLLIKTLDFLLFELLISCSTTIFG